MIIISRKEAEFSVPSTGLLGLALSLAILLLNESLEEINRRISWLVCWKNEGIVVSPRVLTIWQWAMQFLEKYKKI